MSFKRLSPFLLLCLLTGCLAGKQPAPVKSTNTGPDNPTTPVSNEQIPPASAPLPSAVSPNSNPTRPDTSGLSPDDQATVKQAIETDMAEQGIPGLAAAIIKPGVVLWADGFGIANREKNKAVTQETLFLIASISKTLTYTHLLQLYDQGKFKLDDDINDYLPFDASHPDYPDTPITFRMLMSHVSGIQDNDEIDVYSYGSDTDYALADFMKDYFDSEGEYYNPDLNYLAGEPGTAFDYSNMGTALAGYLVETITEKSFSQSSQEMLLSPLGIQNSGWFLKDIDLNNLAIPYDEDESAIEHYTFADYPNGQYRASVTELGQFLAMIMNNGRWQGKTLLKPETMTELQRIQYPDLEGDYGLGFYYYELGDRKLLGHDGGEQGASSAMFYDPQSQTGAIVLMNKADRDPDELLETLLAIGDKY